VYPVAYAVDRSDLAGLADRDEVGALKEARVVASSEWKAYLLVVLIEWLHEKKIDLDRPPSTLRPTVTKLIERWDTVVLVLTDELRRRYAPRLARLHPDDAALSGFYQEFSEDSLPDAATGMADWLRVVKRALNATGPNRVIVIPYDD
jgi:hypothetical protein